MQTTLKLKFGKYRGEYSSSESYSEGDVVNFDSRTFVAKIDNPKSPQNNTHWFLSTWHITRSLRDFPIRPDGVYEQISVDPHMWENISNYSPC